MVSTKRQTWRIKLLTPLHIGCGQTLVEQFDWVRTPTETLVLDQERIWQEMLGQSEKLDLAMLQQPPSTLIKAEDLKAGSPFVKYRLSGLPKGADQRELQALLKDVYGRPYIPGSSLKGMLRTILLWALVNERAIPFNAATFDGRSKMAASVLEADAFGPDPNHDLLRALRVGDSTPVQQDAIVLRTVYAFGSATPIPINLEALKAGTELRCDVSFDELLATEPSLRFFPRAVAMLSELPVLARSWTETRLEEEQTYLGKRNWTKALEGNAKLQKQLGRLNAGSFMLQLGWGTGWLGKTIGPALSTEQREPLIERYRLSRGRRQPGDDFPRSRRLLGSGDQPPEPYIPFGWMQIDTAAHEE